MLPASSACLPDRPGPYTADLVLLSSHRASLDPFGPLFALFPVVQEVEKEDRTGDKHTMTAVKLQVVVEKV